MSFEKCKNCGNRIILDEYAPTFWKHQINSQPPCSHGEPGMGLLETIQEYYSRPEYYASWAYPATAYTKNAILHGLRMQATVHWNNCTNSKCGNCASVGKSTADIHMRELENGRHDLHPSDDDEVFSLAFKIHDASGHGKPGIMTCSYVVGPHSDPCACYEQGYIEWLVQRSQKLARARMTATVIDPDDLYYEPRFE